MAPQAADAAAAAEWLGRLSGFLDSLQLGVMFQLVHQVPRAIDEAVGEAGKLTLVKDTRVTLTVTRMSSKGGATPFKIGIVLEPDGFLTLNSPFGRSPAVPAWVGPIQVQLALLGAQFGFAQLLLAAPRLHELNGIVLLTDVPAGRRGGLPALRVESLELGWRPEGLRQAVSGGLGSTWWVERELRRVANEMVASVNQTAQKVSTLFVEQASGPALRRIVASANERLNGAGGGNPDQLFQDLLSALGISNAVGQEMDGCAAAGWLNGFRELRCHIWVKQALTETVSAGGVTGIMEFVAPFALELVFRYDPNRKVVTLVLTNDPYAPAPNEETKRRRPEHPGILLRGFDHAVRVQRLVFEHPLEGVGTGRFTDVELRLVGGIGAWGLAGLEKLSSLFTGGPGATHEANDSLVAPHREQVLARLNQEAASVAVVIDGLLEQAAAQLPKQLQASIATVRAALVGPGTCQPRILAG